MKGAPPEGGAPFFMPVLASSLDFICPSQRIIISCWRGFLGAFSVHKQVVWRAVAFAAGLLPSCALAQATLATPAATQPTAQPQAIEGANSAAPVCSDCVVIPKLTPVRIEMLTDLGSKLSKTGDTFPIKLAYPIMINGGIIVPAGAMGMGEVIFAKGSGGGGAGGELVLAARFLDVGTKRIRLRSLQLDASGKSRIDSANAMGIAGAAAPGLALVALFMKGKQSIVAAGTIADAKTAEDITFAPDEIAAAVAAAAAMPTTGPQTAPAAAAQPASQQKGK